MMKRALMLFVALVVCSSASASAPSYNAFLRQIAIDCKPLIIGSDDVGQSILRGGMSTDPDNYNAFINYTSRLYRGVLSPSDYRVALEGNFGPGSYNKHSIDCIVNHLPGSQSLAPMPLPSNFKSISARPPDSEDGTWHDGTFG